MSYNEDEKPLSLGISMGEQYRQEREYKLAEAKYWRDLPKMRLKALLMSVVLLGFSFFIFKSLIETLILQGFLPGRTITHSIITRKEEIHHKNSRVGYRVYWTDPITGIEESESVLLDEWQRFRQGQPVEIMSLSLSHTRYLVDTRRMTWMEITFKLAVGIPLWGFTIYIAYLFFRK